MLALGWEHSTLEVPSSGAALLLSMCWDTLGRPLGTSPTARPLTDLHMYVQGLQTLDVRPAIQ